MPIKNLLLSTIFTYDIGKQLSHLPYCGWESRVDIFYFSSSLDLYPLYFLCVPGGGPAWTTPTDSLPSVPDWGQLRRRPERKEWLEAFIPQAPSLWGQMGLASTPLSTWHSFSLFYHLLSPLAPSGLGVGTAPLLPALGCGTVVNSTFIKLPLKFS